VTRLRQITALTGKGSAIVLVTLEARFAVCTAEPLLRMTVNFPGRGDKEDNSAAVYSDAG
jgi:hypothetical protein